MHIKMTLGDFVQKLLSGEIRQHPLRREKLHLDLERRVRRVYYAGAHLLFTTYEQFELGFCRDEHPESELKVWESIVRKLKRRSKKNPQADRAGLLHDLIIESFTQQSVN